MSWYGYDMGITAFYAWQIGDNEGQSNRGTSEARREIRVMGCGYSFAYGFVRVGWFELMGEVYGSRTGQA